MCIVGDNRVVKQVCWQIPAAVIDAEQRLVGVVLVLSSGSFSQAQFSGTTSPVVRVGACWQVARQFVGVNALPATPKTKSSSVRAFLADHLTQLYTSVCTN